jgi:hypothetical protein
MITAYNIQGVKESIKNRLHVVYAFNALLVSDIPQSKCPAFL